ncbi:MAG: hypothetical protein V1826_00855 [bacterium]
MAKDYRDSVRVIGVIAGIIIVLGVLAVGGQYLLRLSGYVSADVADTVQSLPTDEIKIPKEDFVKILNFSRDYALAGDNATKTGLVQDYTKLLDSIAQSVIDQYK